MNEFRLDTQDALVAQADMQEPGRSLRRHLVLFTTASVIALAMAVTPAKLDPTTFLPGVSSAYAGNGQGVGDQTQDRDRDQDCDQVDEPDQDQDQDRDRAHDGTGLS